MPVPRAAAWIASTSVAVALAPAAAAQDPAHPFRDSVVVRVHALTEADVRAALALTDDLWSHAAGVGDFDMRVTAAQRAALDASGIPYDVLIADLEARIEAEHARVTGAAGAAGGFRPRADDWFVDFRNLAAMNQRMADLAAANPSVAQVFTVGTSYEGRAIKGIRVSLAPNPAAAPAVMFHGCQHAREWASPMTAMYVADRLVSGAATDPRLAALLSRAAVYVVPVVNPDGYEYTWASSANRLWRKNRQPNGDGTVGTDINRNWAYGWGGSGSSGVTSNDTYRGPAAFSTPEAAAMRDFYVAHPQVVASLDFHTYSQLLLWPWGWTSALCPDDAVHRAVGTAMHDAIGASAGKSYTWGPVYSTIYPAAGGSIDWTYGQQHVISFAIEERDTGTYGFVMPASEILPTARENFEAALAMMEGTLAPAFVAPAATMPSVLVAGQPTTVAVRVTATTGTVTGAVLHARVPPAAAFGAVAMTAGASGTYSAALPAAPCGATVEWWFEATSATGSALLPAAGAAAPYSAPARDRTLIHEETFEAGAGGWTVGATGDNATAGLWTLVDPVGTAAQPEDDRTSTGTKCWVTGQGTVGGAVGAADVDGGTTTLVSPLLDGSDLSATVSYWRWWSNDQGAAPYADSMLVEWSRDGTTWTTLEDVSENAHTWVERRWALSSFLPSAGTFRIRFRARDLGTDSVVEAGVDDVRIERSGCALVGDLNGDGLVNGADLGVMLSAWGPANGSPADLDRNGSVDGADLGLLLSHWGP